MKIFFGNPFEYKSLRGRHHPDFSPENIIPALAEGRNLLDQNGARIIHDERNRLGIIALKGTGESSRLIMVKEFRTRGVDTLKSLFQASKAEKSWQGAAALVERKIGTPPPLLFYEERRRRFISRSGFIMEYFENAEEIRTLFRRLSGEKLHILVRRLGEFLSISHKQGVFHRDLSDGNILVSWGDCLSPQFFMIDTNRIRIKKIGKLNGIRNLIRLGIPPEKQRFFLSVYLDQRNLSRKGWRWYKLAKAVYSGNIKFKKFLRLKRLVRWLKIQ